LQRNAKNSPYIFTALKMHRWYWWSSWRWWL